MDGPSQPEDVCRNCGESLNPSDNFCQYCGEEIGRADAAAEDRTPPRQGQLAGSDPEPTTGRTVPTEWEDPPETPTGGSGPGAPGTMRGKESRIRTLGVAVAIVIAAMVVPLVGLGLLGAALFATGLPSTAVLLVLVLLQFSWFAAFGLWYLRYRGHDWDSIKAYFGIKIPSLKDVGLIIVTWFVMLFAAVLVASVLMEIIPELLGIEQAEPAENQVNEIIENNPEIVLGAVVFMFLVVGPAEELLFRGVVQNRIREQFSTLPGILIASFLFASVHVFALASTDPIAISMTITVLFVTSLGLGWIYEYTGNLVVPTLLHGFHNSVIVAVTALGAMSDINQQAALLLPEWIAGVAVWLVQLTS